jgi:Na+-driven multidrug efflux pump
MGIAGSKERLLKESYLQFILPKIAPYTVSRAAPFLSTVSVTLFLANVDFSSLSVFGYLLAIFAIVSTVLTMPLAMVGNISVSSKNSAFSQQVVLVSSLALAMILTPLSIFSNYVIYDIFVDVSGFADGIVKTAEKAVLVYLIGTFFSGISLPIFYFLEARGYQGSVYKAKVISLLSTWLMLAYYFFGAPAEPLVWAFACMLVADVVFFFSVLYILMSKAGEYFRWRGFCFDKRVANKVFVLGWPVAVGLSVQKVLYYLINERALSINSDYVGLLSIFGSLSTLFLIPVISFAQANSLYVSKQRAAGCSIVKLGESALVFLSVVVVSCALCAILFPFLFEVFNLGGATLLSGSLFLLSLVLFIFSSGSLTFLTGALRGLEDTFAPQLIINCVMMVVFIPVVWLSAFDQAEFHAIVNLQSLFLMVCALVLAARYMRATKGSNNVELERCK